MCTSEAEQAVYDYYMKDNLTGGEYVESHIFQKGSGLGSIISAIGKSALPLFKKVASDRNLDLTGSTLKDILSGKNVKKSLLQNTNAKLENMVFDTVNKTRKKRLRKKKPLQKAKKRRKQVSNSGWLL
jgi:hypothetical protein